ncbi:DUF2254 domain-containing protein [Massilia sp. Mn16-1_5]|uniref:DUF2254 domain-containing protein n=1 Tax=Massilia sp. Mn16-1_5 TaxID=2079199 RepID=UPI00109EA2B6|nr:DUF2254 domain-containing protein [Massilia sp. Mn16-1_5]THC41858.1 DUF2254 domain-containing protein [Massilia sp. Mn16-1_5]
MYIPGHFQFLLNRLRERLWVKPVIACVLSVAGVLLAHAADGVALGWKVPDIAQSSVIDLLKIVAASMLGVATFAVASMVAAYASTGQSATARAFPLVVADDVSQNALSIFVGTFIFSIIALSASTNDYFGKPGRFTLFVLTLLSLIIVVLVFVRWVDRIARLGRLGAVIGKVEQATAQAMARRRERPCLGGLAADGPPCGLAFHSEEHGSLQRIDMPALQRLAARCRVRITLAVVPGAVIVPSRPLGYVLPDAGASEAVDPSLLRKAFVIGPHRHFDEDPRFGLVVLAEIGCRALSPAVNDPGTAISVLGALQRLFAGWVAPAQPASPEYDRVEVPRLSLDDMFDDAFPALARDGAGLIEVAMRVQRVLGELGRCGDAQLAAAAHRHAVLALARAERALAFPPDLYQLRLRHADYLGPCPAHGAQAADTKG